MSLSNVPKRIQRLAKKWWEGTITLAEQREFNLWYNGFDDELLDVTANETTDQLKERMYNAILQTERINPHRKQIKLFWWFATVAASVLIVLGGGLFYYINMHDQQSTLLKNQVDQDIKPGGNKAYLILANGKRISLTEANSGTLVKEAGVEIRKIKDGQLVYGISANRPIHMDKMTNTIETPCGGQYQVTLPDGTKVWLNAASRLKYPVSFVSLKERKVELNGEAYFEVIKDKNHPFIVKSVGQEVEVLGTHFNISSYTDEKYIKTTLLEGSIRINGLAGVVLKPDQQAVLEGNMIKVHDLNASDAIAWKNGEFVFENESLSNIMREISRWYDVEIEYKGISLKDTQTFSGSVSRFDQVSKVLDILEEGGDIHFRLESRKIIVSK